ncbi:hypothetical protein [Brevibacillus sp. BC25]|uniref:hypothetical protein n=1 Tax=Brevibacillus sp. BC25 TaxID=1144308 RepID=UPI0002714EA6|nr:hypothetical protein [Brevibacillus sp. BC25]EJL29402.1 hypothetical protein PMI05_01800 [Brevibacillus sp. BC25]
MNLKKLMPLLFCSLLLTGSLVNFAVAQEQTSPSVLESINTEDLKEHPDVEEYIRNQGFEHLLKGDSATIERGSEKYELLSEELFLEELEKPEALRDIDISEEKLEEIATELGLEKPKPDNVTIKENILIKRNKDTNAVSNVWYLYYAANDSAFTVSIINVGFDKIDSIVADLRKYNKKGKEWVVDANTSLRALQVGNGNVFKWELDRNAVSDYFEFDIVVLEDGTVWHYDNKSGKLQYEWQRYYFDVGAYKSIKPLGGERHHIVSDKALQEAGFSNTDSFPAIRMMKQDHEDTPNWGNRTSSKEWRAKELEYLNNEDYKGLMRFEVDGFRNETDDEGKFPNLAIKYNDYLVAGAVLAYEYFGVN